MSTAQPESAHSQGETQAAPLLQSNNLQGEITQQATSPTPTTRPAKNPKRVAAGKLVAERTRQAREAQKKAAAETTAIIAKKQGPRAPCGSTGYPRRKPLKHSQHHPMACCGQFSRFIDRALLQTWRAEDRIQRIQRIQQEKCSASAATTRACA